MAPSVAGDIIARPLFQSENADPDSNRARPALLDFPSRDLKPPFIRMEFVRGAPLQAEAGGREPVAGQSRIDAAWLMESRVAEKRSGQNEAKFGTSRLTHYLGRAHLWLTIEPIIRAEGSVQHT